MSKRKKIFYWIFTIWLSLGMLSSGILQLIHFEDVVKNFEKLGYPMYLLTIIGIWKILGVVAVLVPKYPRIKEWAYAGFFFLMSGALVSHIFIKDPFSEIFPAILTLIILAISYKLRPDDRKLVTS